MNIYFAASKHHIDRLDQAAVRIKRAGHVIVSKWIWFPDDMPRQEMANRDIEDVAKCDILVEITGSGKGGRHVEFGYALAFDKQLAIIGDREHIFHEMHRVRQFADLDEFLDYLEA